MPMDGLGDANQLAMGVFKMHCAYGSGSRLYRAPREGELVLLLIGGDKSSQQRDIAKAKKLNLEYR